MRWSRLLVVAGLLLATALEAKPTRRGESRDSPARAVEGRPALAAHLAWHDEQGPVRQPMSLTASDGTGLQMRSLQVRSVVTDPLAFTELHMSFVNPEARVIEGRFEITLPPGAAISRFAMKIGDQWQEGEVVERQAARRAYEDFLHRRQDPALLESKAGNQFRARVFPIPASGVKELILSYSQELRGSQEPYQVMLRGLPELERFDAELFVDTWDRRQPRQVFEAHEQGFTPERDLRVVVDDWPRSVGLRNGDLAVARIQPMLDQSAEPVRGLTVLLDTSASRALGFEGQLSRLTSAFHAIDQVAGRVPIEVLAFDQQVHRVYQGPASQWGPDQERALLHRGALGASDLEGALSWLGTHRPAHDRLLVVTDGIPTAGELEAAALREDVEALGQAGVSRVDALVDGGIRDEALLHQLVTTLPNGGVVLEARESPVRIAERLSRATRSGIEVHVPGAEWVWPETLDGVQSGDEVLVYARLETGAPMSVWLSEGYLDRDIAMSMAPRPLVERANARAEIARLSHLRGLAEDPEVRAELAEHIVGVSTRFRVLSDLTALLVLETEADYERYGIDRRALADVLRVGPDGLEVLERAEPVYAPVEPRQEARQEALAERQDVEQVIADEGGFEEDIAADPMDAMDVAPPAMEPPPPPPATLASAEYAEETRVEYAADESAMEYEVERRERRGVAASVRATAGRLFSRDDEDVEEAARPQEADAWDGRFAEVMQLITAERAGSALEEAMLWRSGSPGDVLALVALGEALEATGDLAGAARAYGSLIDLYPSRADLRRMAGERLERLGEVGVPLAADSYARAVEQRPDHPHGHRLLAWALVEQGRHGEAVEVLAAALERDYPRFEAAHRILREDLGLVAAAWIRAEPASEGAIRERLDQLEASVADEPSLRFVLAWETDANDVDFHIYDGEGGHAYYSSRDLPSGGSLYADITTGYGPECFTIEGKGRAWPYTLQAHYYSRGPMGYGMGTLQVIEHDGQGGLAFSESPFVIMKDGAYVDLGYLEGSLL